MSVTFRGVPVQESIIEDKYTPISNNWGIWLRDVRDRILTSGPIFNIECTITASNLDGGKSQILYNIPTGTTYKVRRIVLSGAGTNFAAGGDRNIVIQDTSGNAKYTVIPNATIESLAAGSWGSTPVPFPATASHIFKATTSGDNLIAKYSGGTTDHSGTGSLTVLLELEQVT